MTIRCEIVSQDRTVLQGDVDIVVLPGDGGEMGVLPHHAPVLTVSALTGEGTQALMAAIMTTVAARAEAERLARAATAAQGADQDPGQDPAATAAETPWHPLD